MRRAKPAKYRPKDSISFYTKPGCYGRDLSPIRSCCKMCPFWGDCWFIVNPIRGAVSR
jgi:hypothetical protein